MQLTLAAIAAAITLAAADPTPQSRVRNFYSNRCSNNPFPNGYDAGIGPTSCNQLVADCGYYGNGQVCTTDYTQVQNCVGGQYTGYGDYCYPGTRCLAAVDGSGATCVSENQPGPPPPPSGNRCSNNPFPNGQGAGIGPTDCGQLTRDCGFYGVGQVCSTVYDQIVDCYNGQEYGRSQTCYNGERCLAAVDGSGARCVR